VYVGNITASITEETLLALFAHCGQVTNVRISGYVRPPPSRFYKAPFLVRRHFNRTRPGSDPCTRGRSLCMLLLHPQSCMLRLRLTKSAPTARVRLSVFGRSARTTIRSVCGVCGDACPRTQRSRAHVFFHFFNFQPEARLRLAATLTSVGVFCGGGGGW